MSLVVFQFFHQADLGFLLYRFMGRTVFTYTEGIVCPDELHGNFHQGCHTYGRFHVVGEYEESSASGDYTAMQCHTDTATCHSQLGNTGLEECTAEVTFLEGMCFLEESVCLVGIGKVGRSNNHIFYLSGESTEHSGRCCAGGNACFLFDGGPIHFGSLAGEKHFQFGSLFWIGFCPCGFGCILFSHDFLQLSCTLGI